MRCYVERQHVCLTLSQPTDQRKTLPDTIYSLNADLRKMQRAAQHVCFQSQLRSSMPSDSRSSRACPREGGGQALAGDRKRSSLTAATPDSEDDVQAGARNGLSCRTRNACRRKRNRIAAARRERNTNNDPFHPHTVPTTSQKVHAAFMLRFTTRFHKMKKVKPEKRFIYKGFRWCRRRELNSRPHPYQGCALPLSYCGGKRVLRLSGGQCHDGGE